MPESLVRLWAFSGSITLGEYLPLLGVDTEVALGLSITYIGRGGRDAKARGWPFELSSLGAAALVQLPGLERSFTAVTGSLAVDGSPPSWRIGTVVPLAVLGARKDYIRRSLDRVLGDDTSAACEALGTLSICGRELAGSSGQFVAAKVHRFQSFCLRAGDPRFGTWYDVTGYGDLGSDPDVIAASVCLAEVELIELAI